jgi:hypothetical protein
MKKLKTLKGSSELRVYSNLLTITENAIRWLGKQSMVDRSFALENSIESMSVSIEDKDLPTRSERIKLHEVKSHLFFFGSVTKLLQEKYYI